MKRFFAFLLCAGMTASLAACDSTTPTQTETPASPAATAGASAGANTPQPDEADSPVSAPTEMTFIFADGDEAFKTSMNRAVDGFNEAHPDITIRIQPGDGGAYSEFLKTKDSVGEFPDMMEMRDTAMYVRAGKLAPLSDDIVSLFKTTMKFDGKAYTAPYAGENTQGILYNKKYFSEKGLDTPKTWDEFLALCQKIKDLGDMAPIVVGGQDIWHMGFWFHKLYADNVLTQDSDFIKHCYEGTANFSDEKIVRTISDMQELFQYAQDGWTSTPDAQITTFLVSDMAAMMFSGTHMFSQIADADPDFELGWFPVPDRNGKIHLVGGAGIGGLALSAEAAQDPDKQAAFDAFLRYFYDKPNYKRFLETMSYLPVTTDAPEIEGTPVYLEVVDAVNRADTLSPMWNGLSGDNELPPDFRNFTYKTVVEVIQGSRTIESACEELQKTWDVAAAGFNPVTGMGIE